jgi:hypothetical protein
MFRTRTSINACCLPLCTCLRVQVFIFGCALYSLWQCLCLSREHLCTSLHQGKDAPCSGATKGTMPSCPQHFCRNFSKYSNNFVETDRTSKKFFDGNSNSRKAKMKACVRWRLAYSFRAPSANAPAAARRLVSTSLVSGFHLNPFREHLSDHRDSGPKEEFARPKPQLKLSPEPLEVPGAANERLCLAVRRGQALRLLRPRGSGARLDCFASLSTTVCCCSRPQALGSDREITPDEKPSYAITWQRVQIITNGFWHV